MTGRGSNTVGHTFGEVYEACLGYFHGDAVAAKDWMNKCAVKSETGTFHERSPEEGFRRVARALAVVEKQYPNPLAEEQIYNLLGGFRHIIPSAKLILKTGNPFRKGLLSDSFVISQEEFDYSGRLIPKAHEEIAFLMRNMAAAGIDLSFVPPLYHRTGEGIVLSQGLGSVVKQLSQFNDDYNTPLCMGKPGFSISLDHPDLPGVIDAFMDREIVPWAEITVRVKDKDLNSMKSLEKLSYWIHKETSPVVAFEDNIVQDSLSDCYSGEGFRTSSFVPLSSLPLSPYECVHPLSLNLYNFVDSPFSAHAKINENDFNEHVNRAVRFADDFIDLEIRNIGQLLDHIGADIKNREVRVREENILHRIRKKLISGRRLSVGVTGYADMVAALGLRYGSEEALQLTGAVFEKLAVAAFHASAELAGERGAFPVFRPESEVNNRYFKKLMDKEPGLADRMMACGRRNIAILATGNGGDLARMSGVSHNFQPIFSPYYLRRKKVGAESLQKEYDFIDEEGTKWKDRFELHPGFEHFLKIKGCSSQEIAAFNEEQLQDFHLKSPYFKSTRADIGVSEQIDTLARIQSRTDQNVRHTITVSNSTTPREIAQIISYAHRCGVKTLHIYRERFYMDTSASD